MKHQIYGEELKNMPYESHPQGCDSPIWRYSKNPIIKVNPFKGASRVFNSAVMAYQGEFIGVFRADTNTGIPYLFLGRSKDGINFTFDEKPIVFHDKDGNPLKMEYGYDPRLTEIDDTYYIIFCTSNHGPTLGIGKTKDFKYFELVDNPFLPFNRNGVLFPRKINGQYYMLSRPSDLGHTPFGDIFVSSSPDMRFWGEHKLVLKRAWSWWTSLKIGGGPAPIELDDGWLIFIHGVTNTCNGYVYSIGAIIVDKDDVSKVKYRCDDYLLTPTENYEISGFVPNVVFPTSVLVDGASGRIAMYYGAADSYTCLAFGYIDELVDYIKKHSTI